MVRNYVFWLFNRRIVSVIILVPLLAGCLNELFPPPYRELFSEEANAKFLDTIDVQLTPEEFFVKVSSQFIKRDDSAYLWFDNKTGKTLWFPNVVRGVNAYEYDSATKEWRLIQLYILVAPEEQKPIPAEPGCHGPELLTIGIKLSPGPIRLLYIGSTDPQNPGVTGEVYANYVDIEVLSEVYEPQAYKQVRRLC